MPDEEVPIVVFGWILMGVAVGLAADVLTPGRRRETAVVYPLLGTIGAVIGGVATARSAAAVGGAVLIVALYALTAGRSRHSGIGPAIPARVRREVS